MLEINRGRLGTRLRGACLPIALLTLLAACAAPGMHDSASQAGPQTTDQRGVEPPTSSAVVALNPLVLAVPVAPQAIAASDRRTHLTYEVLATNITRQALRVESIAVHAAGDANALVHYEGDAVAARMSLLADPTVPIDVLAPSMTATLWIDVALAAGAAVPPLLDTRVSVTAGGDAAEPVSVPVTDVRIAVNPVRARVLQPPLSGDLWAAIEGCCDFANHHRRGQRSVAGHLVLPERYAIDFVQVDEHANLYLGSNINEHYFGFGKPVLAVADATVVDVYDGLADIAPGAPLPPPTLPAAGGNHVILDLGGGVWAMYGHLKAGSIRVHAGDTVQAGEILAALGNNGNSDLAHLHFQLMDSRNFALAQGVPFVFDRYVQVGTIDTAADKIVNDPSPETHTDELPLSLSVVNFPGPSQGR